MTEPHVEQAAGADARAVACACSGVRRADVSDPRARRWAWWLTAGTIAWNVVEGIVAIAGGVVAGSIALVGFGLDSFMEVSSALVIAWRLSRHGEDEAANERAEMRAVRLIAAIFFAIAVYVAYDSMTKLLGIGREPERSPVGLAITALSLIVMPSLAWGKRRVARTLGSVALKADSAQTQLCCYRFESGRSRSHPSGPSDRPGAEQGSDVRQYPHEGLHHGQACYSARRQRPT